MNLRKLLNILNKHQKIMIDYDITNIMINCEKLARIEDSEQKESQKFHNNNCKNCQSKNKVVDKIASVEGKIIISSKVNTIISLDTFEVNHCKECGHEWKKFKLKTVTKKQILIVALNYLAECIDTENSQTYKLEIIYDVFNKSHAESIYSLFITNKKLLNKSTQSKLSLKILRKKYKSIYN